MGLLVLCEIEQILLEEESFSNDNTDEENTTLDMYAGDVDIIFGLWDQFIFELISFIK